MLLALVIILFTGAGIAYAGTTDFNKVLPPGQVHVTIVDYSAKQTGTDGSYLRLNSAGSANETVLVWTDLQFVNGGAVVQFSPQVTISTRLGYNYQHWLGAYVQYNANVGDKIRLRMCSTDWLGDGVSGTWDYK